MTGTPQPEIAIDAELVRSLLLEQHADLAALPLDLLDCGWDNAMYRLGDRWLVRLPRRSAAAALLVNEQRWLPQLARRLPLPIPAPVRTGKATQRYPWPWSIVPWLPGAPADTCELRFDQASALAAFLKSLHIAAPSHAPRNPVRGVALSTRAGVMKERIARLQSARVLEPGLLEIWNAALEAPIDSPDTWIHGDLHARNALVEHGRFSAIIDWGDVGQGDRATDLASIWTLLPERVARQHALQLLSEVSNKTWTRARGWAVLFGVTLLDSGRVDHPRHARMGEQILQRLLVGP